MADAVVFAHQAQSEAELGNLIGDRVFMQQLDYTRDLIIFMLRRQQVPVKDYTILSALGARHYFPGARRATTSEWEKLYNTSQEISGQLKSEMAANFAIWRLRKFFSLYPLIYLATAARYVCS